MKLHLCCGEVYLEGYTNIDIEVPGYSFLAPERLDLVEINTTTLDKYYKYPLSNNPSKKCVVDDFCDVRSLSLLKYPDNSAEEILMFSSFEHFTHNEAKLILRDVYSILLPGGKFYFNFPDIEESFKSIQNNRSVEDIEWQIRLIYGSYKNQYNVHKWGYTKETIVKDLYLTAEWSKIEFVNLIKTDYPMIGVCATK